MKIVTLDVETTTTHKQNGAWTPSPFFENRLVSLGYKDITSVGVEYLCFYHSEQRPDLNGWDEVQRVLNQTDMLIGHNIKFDLMWLRECGWKYDGKLYDTMVAEYLLSGSRRWPLGLASLAQKYEVGSKRKDLVQPYLDEGLTFDKIPYHIVEEYGKEDVFVTERIALEQTKAFGTTLEMLCNDS